MTFEELIAKWDIRDSYNLDQLYDSVNGSVESGWFPILETLFETLKSKGWQGDVAQIKQKYGELRVYLHPDTRNREWLEVTFMATAYSLQTCEFCSNQGHLRTARKYVRTLCDSCDQAR